MFDWICYLPNYGRQNYRNYVYSQTVAKTSGQWCKALERKYVSQNAECMTFGRISYFHIPLSWKAECCSNREPQEGPLSVATPLGCPEGLLPRLHKVCWWWGCESSPWGCSDLHVWVICRKLNLEVVFLCSQSSYGFLPQVQRRPSLFSLWLEWEPLILKSLCCSIVTEKASHTNSCGGNWN